MTICDSAAVSGYDAERDFANKLRDALDREFGDPYLLAFIADRERKGLELELVTCMEKPNLWRYCLLSGRGLVRSAISGPDMHIPESVTVEQFTRAWFTKPRNGDPYKLFLREVYANAVMRKLRAEMKKIPGPRISSESAVILVVVVGTALFYMHLHWDSIHDFVQNQATHWANFVATHVNIYAKTK